MEDNHKCGISASIKVFLSSLLLACCDKNDSEVKSSQSYVDRDADTLTILCLDWLQQPVEGMGGHRPLSTGQGTVV